MESPRFDVSISLVSHGQGGLIRRVLADLQAWRDVSAEVIITLNVPEDEAFLSENRLFPQTVIRNMRRKGFGANHNGAFSVSRSDCFAVVNPDVRTPGFSIVPLLEQLRGRGIGVVAPRVVDSRGRSEDSARVYPTLARIVRRRFGGETQLDYPVGNGPLQVDWAAGMFLVFDSEAFRSVGGFDEGYFMYLEDADICRRLRRIGWDVLYVPEVSIVHDAQRASHKNLRHALWHGRSLARFLLDLRRPRSSLPPLRG